MASKKSIRVNSQTRSYYRYTPETYEYGSAVRKLDYFEEPIQEQEEVLRPKVSKQTKKNRQRATAMSRGYVIFLAAVCIAVIGMCVMYLKLQTTITTQTKQIAAREKELSELRADNDAYYNETMASIDLEAIKDVALNRLGMHYADETQIIYFDTSGSSYVRQYQDVPGAEKK